MACEKFVVKKQPSIDRFQLRIQVFPHATSTKDSLPRFACCTTSLKLVVSKTQKNERETLDNRLQVWYIDSNSGKGNMNVIQLIGLLGIIGAFLALIVITMLEKPSEPRCPQCDEVLDDDQEIDDLCGGCAHAADAYNDHEEIF